ncbi:VrrA/YqfQ family protein [Sporosarcina gallistercoris]|uniref:VrrA/YqfQ family protein n=1 Tax=Sporosarcina gallistercoris TaxID=2762245 RepID=UPI003D266A52
MRYQSFYPFANQQRQTPAGQQMFRGNIQQANPFMQGPSIPFPQSQANQQPSPFGMNPGFGDQQQAQGGSPAGAGLSKPEMYMETANRLMSTVQQYAPIVQQFAPMIQNIPAMWKLYRGFQSLPDAGAAGASVAATAARGAAPVTSGPLPSVPKVFQPPI